MKNIIIAAVLAATITSAAAQFKHPMPPERPNIFDKYQEWVDRCAIEVMAYNENYDVEMAQDFCRTMNEVTQ